LQRSPIGIANLPMKNKGNKYESKSGENGEKIGKLSKWWKLKGYKLKNEKHQLIFDFWCQSSTKTFKGLKGQPEPEQIRPSALSLFVLMNPRQKSELFIISVTFKLTQARWQLFWSLSLGEQFSTIFFIKVSKFLEYSYLWSIIFSRLIILIGALFPFSSLSQLPFVGFGFRFFYLNFMSFSGKNSNDWIKETLMLNH